MNILISRSVAVRRTNGPVARVCALAALVLTAIAISASPASADGLATVKGCLSGEFGPYDEVASWDNGKGNFHLLCGDETKGLGHIDAGHGPLDVGNVDSLFLNCMSNIFIYGDSSGTGAVPNSTVWSLTYARPFDVGMGVGNALALVDNATGHVLTAYANWRDTNDWLGCNAGTPAAPR